MYSQKARDFDSENEEILKAIETVSRGTGGRGTWVMDRGGDRREILALLLRCGALVLLYGGYHSRSPARLFAGIGFETRQYIDRELGEADDVPPPFTGPASD